MDKNYSTRDFFRQMPNALLARYFQGRDIFGDLDFTTMKEGNRDELFAAWLVLPVEKRNTMDAEFMDIFNMSCQKGFLAIIDEAPHHFKDTPEAIPPFVEMLSALPSHYERAMVTFLDHKTFWKGATRLYHADSLSYWRKRKNLPHKTAAVDDASIRQLADLIRNYFHHTEGRGNNCAVEIYRRGDLDYFFAFPEDYSQQSSEWVDGEFKPRPHNPAFEIVYIYSQKEGSLDLNFRGNKRAIEPLQAMFAMAILKLPELPLDPKDTRVYELKPLLQKSFDFAPAVGSGIEKVVVKKLRLSSRVKKGDRITLEADTNQDPAAVYVLLDKIGKTIPLHFYYITRVDIEASIISDADKPPKKILFHITHPNTCSLKYDELDLKLRDMLEASGIELKEPAEVAEAAESLAPVEA